MRYPLNIGDIDFIAFRRGSGPGGQHKNKTATSIRATHSPTGVVVTCSSERSQHTNKENAIAAMQAKLDRMLEDQILGDRKEAYRAKPQAAFAAQIRTYRMCGNAQGVTDHRTGHSHPNALAVLRGDIDGFLRSAMTH